MEFLSVMFAIIFFVTPQEVNRVQIWPNATDTNPHLKELSLTFRRSGDGWCPDDDYKNKSRCINFSDGKWIDEHGKVILGIKDTLTITNGTNYVMKVKDWDNPLVLSVRGRTNERTFEIKENGKMVREFRVRMWKSASGSEP